MDIYSNYGEHEGFNYLGLGIILIFLTSFAYFLKNFSNYKKKENNIIIFIGIFLFILAISNNIHFGKFNIISFELNKFIYGLLGMIRASGRLFWPIYYVIIIFSMALFFLYNLYVNTPYIISFFLYVIFSFLFIHLFIILNLNVYTFFIFNE